MRVIFRLARKEDNPQLLSLLADSPLTGSISLVFQRKPDYFIASKIEGISSQTIIGLVNKKIVAVGNRALKPMYINGRRQLIGYLSGLRISKNYQGKGILESIFRYLYKLHKDAKVPFYLLVITNSNKAALKALTSGKKDLPKMRYLGDYYTSIINLSRKKQLADPNISVIRGRKSMLSKIVEFINKNGKQKQFFPYYTKKDFLSDYLFKFRLEDLYIGMQKNEIIGILGKWDQREFKQIIVDSYHGKVKLIRPVYDIYSQLAGIPASPKPQSILKFFYASFVVIKNNNCKVLRNMIQHIHNDNLKGGYSHFLMGFYSKDPLLEVAKEFSLIMYKSKIYIAHWDDGKKSVNELDNRIPYLELGAL